MKREVFFQVFKKQADGALECVLVPCPYDDFVEFFEGLDSDKVKLTMLGWAGNTMHFVLEPTKNAVCWVD